LVFPRVKWIIVKVDDHPSCTCRQGKYLDGYCTIGKSGVALSKYIKLRLSSLSIYRFFLTIHRLPSEILKIIPTLDLSAKADTTLFMEQFRPNIVIRQVVEKQLFTLVKYKDKK